jgi:hypothetical protein
MPISREEFVSGRSQDAIVDKISEFLELNKDKAFTEDEILRQLYPDHTAWPGDRIGFDAAVILLSYSRKIEIRFVDTTEGLKVYFGVK